VVSPDRVLDDDLDAVSGPGDDRSTALHRARGSWVCCHVGNREGSPRPTILPGLALATDSSARPVAAARSDLLGSAGAGPLRYRSCDAEGRASGARHGHRAPRRLADREPPG
jgi:hypothetical protein